MITEDQWTTGKGRRMEWDVEILELGVVKQVHDNLRTRDIKVVTIEQYPQHFTITAINRIIPHTEKLVVGTRQYIEVNLEGKKTMKGEFKNIMLRQIGRTDAKTNVQ